MKTKAIVIFLTIFCSLTNSLRGQIPSPKFHYLDKFDFNDTARCVLKGPARVISHDGRTGLNLTSIHSVFKMNEHTLNKKKGSVVFWIMPLEDMNPFSHKSGMEIGNPLYRSYPFLSDCSNPQNDKDANFKFMYNLDWHPSIRVQFTKGNYYEDNFRYPHPAFVSVSHFSMNALKWYQFSLTWNYEQDEYSVYINGILVGKEDQFNAEKMRRDKINDYMYTGNPTLCYSDICFYDQELSDKQIYDNFRKQVVNFEEEYEKELLYTYAGKGRKEFDFIPDKEWEEKMALTLKSLSDLENFYVQGNPISVDITDNGLLIETIHKKYTAALLDSQVYVWSKQVFEGDIYVEYEFKSIRPGGLSLLMVQASGMNREDFMADYPLKKNGYMITVYGENVRNYHWEYYRDMCDVTNYVQNSVLAKNPFGFALSFSALDKPVDYSKWNKLQFLQIGNKLIGAINGVVMIEYTDNSFINNGPVYNFGHIAIRCMLHSKMLFRNIKVYNRLPFQVVQNI